MAAVAATLAIPLSSSPASAASTGSCPAYLFPDFRASGSANVARGSKTNIAWLELTVKDTDADGHSVGIRLRTERSDGSVYNWAWHRNYGGNGSSQTFGTSATDGNGIVAAQAQVGVFEGSDLLASCYTSYISNPYA